MDEDVIISRDRMID